MDQPFKKYKRILNLDTKFFKNMSMWRIFKDTLTNIVSLDFSEKGEFLIAADDYTISLYDCKYGYKIKTVKNIV